VESYSADDCVVTAAGDQIYNHFIDSSNAASTSS